MNETSGSSAGKPASETQKSSDEKVSEKQKVLYAKRHKVFYIRYFKIILYHTNTSYKPFSSNHNSLTGVVDWGLRIGYKWDYSIISEISFHCLK